MIINPFLIVFLIIITPIITYKIITYGYKIIKKKELDESSKDSISSSFILLTLACVGLYGVFAYINEQYITIETYHELQVNPKEYPKYIYIEQGQFHGLRVREYEDNVKYIDSIEQTMPEYKDILRTIFDKYDEEHYDTIITTMDENIAVHELIEHFDYVYLKDIDNETQKLIGFNDEFIQTMYSVPYNKIIILITHTDLLSTSRLKSNPSNSESKLNDQYPYWIIPRYNK